ncbi:MAG: hypothetical protein ACTSRH_11145 [Promethearchaeota archaeon]
MVKVRNPRLRFIRHNLRRFLLHLYYEKMGEILETMEGFRSYHEKVPFRHKLDEIKRVSDRAPLFCQGCGSKSLDMIYYVGMGYWLCEFCYRGYREFERKRGANYRKMYPDYERI